MTTLAPPLKTATPIPVGPIPHRFGMAEYDRLKDLGVIPFGQRTELIRGLIIDILPDGDRRAPHRFEVAEYDRAGELGLIPENTELIRGEVIDKMPHGDPHSMCLDLMTRLLIGLIPMPTCVRCQSPVLMARSAPEPDFSISTPAASRGGKRPTAADVYILIEVSDSTLAGDRSTKLGLYAENAIVEYWIVNLPDDCVEVHTRPDAAELRYDSRAVYGRGHSVPLEIAGLAAQAVPVDSLLP